MSYHALHHRRWRIAIALTAAGRESPEEGRVRGRSGMEVISSLDSDMPARPDRS